MAKVEIELHEGADKPWSVHLGGPEMKNILDDFDMSEEDKEKVFLTAAKILARCPRPDSTIARATLLGLGKVQSGKTSAYTATIALGYDNGYPIAIVLEGTRKNLLGQNTRSIKGLFGLPRRNDRKIAAFSTMDRIDDVRREDVLGVLENGNKVLITVLKHPKHIQHIVDLFSTSEFQQYPVLIVDDEGDQASLNTKVKKRDKSTTYSAILTLRNVFNVHAFIAFTATPQANLLIQTIDELSPEHCILIEPGNGYTGGSTFHGAESKKYIREILEEEVPFELQDDVPISFKKAIATFFIGASIRTIRGDLKPHSMLVHTSHKKSVHQAITSRIKALVDSWKHALVMLEDPQQIHGLLKFIHDIYISEFAGHDQNCPKWEDVESKIRKELRDLKVWEVNSSERGEIPDPDKMNFKNNIFIGGNMLDRGVTLDGLAVTYITRQAKTTQADTVEQRARWFGYKQSYLDVCRVYTPTAISQGFADLLGHEDDLWNYARTMEALGIPVKLWPRLFQLAKPFRPTRSNVAGSKELDYDDWNYQDRLVMDRNIAAENVKAVESFFGSVGAKRKSIGKHIHLVATDCPVDRVINHLLLQLNTDIQGTGWNYVTFAEVLRRLARYTALSSIDVVRMDPDEVRERTVNAKGEIKRLLQGRSVRIARDRPDYYPGDRNVHNGKVQLQVHVIQPRDDNKRILLHATVAFALYVPEDLANMLGRLLMGNE